MGEQPEPEAAFEPIEAVGAHGVRIRLGDRTHLVLFRKGDDNALLRSDGLETDGRVAAAELAGDGTILRAMASGARKLRYEGQTLFDADKPQDWATPAKAEP